jgi:stage II sporulation protein D
MTRCRANRLIAFLLLCALTPATDPALARQSQTRPRRVNPEPTENPTRPAPDPAPAEPAATLPADEDDAGWRAAAASIETYSGHEPLVRVGLTTGARSAVISAAGRLISVEANGSRTALIEAARLRVEPRGHPPLMPTDEEGKAPASSEAASLRTRPTALKSDAKPAAPAPTGAQVSTSKAGAQASATKPGVRLTSRLSTTMRGTAVFAAEESAPRVEARGPITFAPADETRDFVVFGGKPYRGRIEVFTNERGTLTVVNVVGLEDYVRGVVPNELSPGGWPQLEALKAQAVAARTYAVSNAGRFRSEGFDLLPTTRSQVYGGHSTEHPLTDRAVAETRGLVATHAGRPINALYTSTCGGRTENAEDIFGGRPVAYLRSRECAAGHGSFFESHTLRTSRELPGIRAAEHAGSPRDAALLSTHGLALPPRLSDEWLAAPLSPDEARRLAGLAASLARQATPPLTAEAVRPAGFASALAAALDGESRAASLLNSADVDYLLSFRDASEVPEANRADVALLLRDGVVRLYPDATLRPRQPLTRARALSMTVAVLEARGLFRLQKGTARPAEGGSLVLPPAGGKGSVRTLKLAPDAFLFRVYGGAAYPAREVAVVGGEPVVFHLSAAGEVAYLEIGPAPNGAAFDRFSKFSNWSETVSAAALVSRLGRAAASLGELEDVRVRRRGASGRVLDLELVGTFGTTHVTGGRVRTALGLREQLFVVERGHDERGRVVRYTFSGRGWGHGVGMCQVGAYGLARAGADYEKILKAYYTGIGLTRLY